MSVTAHASDMFGVSCDASTIENDYLPHDLGIGGGDDLNIEFCMECGQIQGKYPLPIAEIEETVQLDV